jgi:aminoglycoside 2''-phosphotransferase
MDATAVRRAIEMAFPDLRVAACRYLSEGWDSSVWEVNDSLVFRFPKRAEVGEWLRREIGLLPALAGALPVPIPRFTHIALAGAPADPALPFVGYPKLDGVFLDRAPELLHPASPLVPQLADFLRALHTFPLDRALACGVQPGSWGAWTAHWHSFAARAMRPEDPAHDPATSAWVAATRDAFLAELNAADRPVALLHHDLATEHILVTPAGDQISGVIDWGDVWIGDPALDFAGFAAACDAATLDALLTAYGPVDDGFRRRAVWYARLSPFHLLYFGLHIRDAGRIAEGYEAIRKAAEER